MAGTKHPLKRFGRAKLTLDRGKYFQLHLPTSLSSLLELKEPTIVNIFASLEEKKIILEVVQ
jgi:hypothetical protein